MNKTNFPTNKRALLIATAVLAVLAIGGLLYYFLQKPSQDFVPQNYAKEIASPLEKALVAAGATKLCESGDSGRGWDNKSPWYGAYYELPVNRAEAVELINAAAASNGYSLNHASP